jgi:hypothetical protein
VLEQVAIHGVTWPCGKVDSFGCQRLGAAFLLVRLARRKTALRVVAVWTICRIPDVRLALARVQRLLGPEVVYNLQLNTIFGFSEHRYRSSVKGGHVFRRDTLREIAARLGRPRFRLATIFLLGR